MKKIPTLFEREYADHKVVGIKPVLTSPDLQWVLDGEGTATEKIDGTCCAIIDNLFYKRYDAKKGKKPPEGAIPCSEPDPITGHWPHWVKVDYKDPASHWHIVALENALNEVEGHLNNGTYEAVGPHFQGNPHHLEQDTLIRHGIFSCEKCGYGLNDLYLTNEYDYPFEPAYCPNCGRNVIT